MVKKVKRIKSLRILWHKDRHRKFPIVPLLVRRWALLQTPCGLKAVWKTLKVFLLGWLEIEWLFLGGESNYYTSGDKKITRRWLLGVLFLDRMWLRLIRARQVGQHLPLTVCPEKKHLSCGIQNFVCTFCWCANQSSLFTYKCLS